MTLSDEFSIYRGKKILITGHTGFKGSWLSLCLEKTGADVIGLALDPYTENDLFVRCNLSDKLLDCRIDIRDYKAVKRLFNEHQPDFIFHLAAQTIVGRAYKDPRYTIETNVLGTTNILDCIRHTPNIKGALIVTTDKVYRNQNNGNPFVESDPLGGMDPYSASKASTEIITEAYRDSYFGKGPLISTVRPGNTLGGGDWRALRLIPDCIRALINDGEVLLRKPQATRPWIYVLDVLSAYMMLGKELLSGNSGAATAWNIAPLGDNIRTVESVVKAIIDYWGAGSYKAVGTDSDAFYESDYLSLNTDKIKKELGWSNLYSFDKMIEMTILWYKEAVKHPKVDLYDFTKNQIEEYEKFI